MIKKNLLVFCVLNIFTFSLIAQGIIKPSTTTINLDVLNNLEKTEIGNESIAPSQLQNMGVYVNQIGEGNVIKTKIISENSNINFNQIGNKNQLNLNISAEKVDYTTLQKGNNNVLLDFGYNVNTELLQRNIQQLGSSQQLIIHGNNSLSDKMKITMSKGSQTVIIRNTN